MHHSYPSGKGRKAENLLTLGGTLQGESKSTVRLTGRRAIVVLALLVGGCSPEAAVGALDEQEAVVPVNDVLLRSVLLRVERGVGRRLGAEYEFAFASARDNSPNPHSEEEGLTDPVDWANAVSGFSTVNPGFGSGGRIRHSAYASTKIESGIGIAKMEGWAEHNFEGQVPISCSGWFTQCVSGATWEFFCSQWTTTTIAADHWGRFWSGETAKKMTTNTATCTTGGGGGGVGRR